MQDASELTDRSALLGGDGEAAGPGGAVEADDAAVLALAGGLEVIDVCVPESRSSAFVSRVALPQRQRPQRRLRRGKRRRDCARAWQGGARRGAKG